MLAGRFGGISGAWECPGASAECCTARALPFSITSCQQIIKSFNLSAAMLSCCLTDTAHSTSVGIHDPGEKPGAPTLPAVPFPLSQLPCEMMAEVGMAQPHRVPQVTQEQDMAQDHRAGALGMWGLPGRAAVPSSPQSEWGHGQGAAEPAQQDSSSPQGQPCRRTALCTAFIARGPVGKDTAHPSVAVYTCRVMWNACGWGDVAALRPELAPVPLLPSNYRGVSCWQTDPS